MGIVKKINKTLHIIILSLILVLYPVYMVLVYPQTGYDYYTYSITTGDVLKLGWTGTTDWNVNTDIYVVTIYNVERKIERFIGKTKEESMDVSCPKTGHWIFQVHVERTGPYVDDNPTILIGEKAKSTENGVVDGVEKNWWVFAWIAPVGPIDVSKKIIIKGDVYYV